MHRHIIPDVVKSQHVCALSETSTVTDLAKEMTACNVAAIIVLGKSGKMVGIATERDIARRVIAKGLDPAIATLKQIMTPNPTILRPDNTAGDALELMRTRNFRHLPVCDGDEVIAMVSIRDLYAAVKADLEDDNREIEAFVFGNQYGV